MKNQSMLSSSMRSKSRAMPHTTNRTQAAMTSVATTVRALPLGIAFVVAVGVEVWAQELR